MNGAEKNVFKYYKQQIKRIKFTSPSGNFAFSYPFLKHYFFSLDYSLKDRRNERYISIISFKTKDMKKIAVYNIKGGVGKTTTCVNLACMLAKGGLSVLLWDLDPQGGSSFFFDLQNRNNNTHARLFDGYITIYDVIQSTESYQIDVISNDSFFSDQFMNRASKLTALTFTNSESVKNILSEVEDDYDVCIIDCSPGRFMIHDNVFHTSDLMLIPNIPAPLSVYCNNMLMDSLLKKMPAGKRMLSFYNMVQAHKNLHKHFLHMRQDETSNLLNSYVPFYSEIESITLSKESIFHQLKEFKTNIYYNNLWREICERMRWPSLNILPARVVNMKNETKMVHRNTDNKVASQSAVMSAG
jgi:cellulose biosynthesis protein BcsQ